MKLHRFLGILFKSLIQFLKDGGLMLASSISYFFMMAFVPFCLLLITIFGNFLGEHQEFMRFFSEKLTSFFPDITYEITGELKKIITYTGLGKFSLVLYGLLSYQLFSSLEAAINTIFKSKVKRAFIISVILSLFIITLISIFILASFSATTAISMLTMFKEFFPSLQVGRITGFLIGVVIPLILVLLTSATLYILLPKKRIRLLHALAGALFTAVFFETAKHLFTIYVIKVVKLGSIYGSLSAFIIFLLWVFYSACIFLIGAEVVNKLGEPKKRS
ncbi:MAG: YihY/virulence factor BrkB family protein [Thermodesulfovibrionales bacterium]|nr:YihY/virulence factor BrkB family protein [Thermodesulfovibrionales bacterium]